MNPLISFIQNEVLRETLKAYMQSVIDQEALQMMYEGKDVSHIKDAKTLLDKTFSQLENEFRIQRPTPESTNQAK
jgi:hypothetical protein